MAVSTALETHGPAPWERGQLLFKLPSCHSCENFIKQAVFPRVLVGTRCVTLV